MKSVLLWISVCTFVLVQGLSDARSLQISVKEGDPVTLHTGVDIKKKEDKMIWYFKNGRIAISNGDDIICEDNGCKKRFGDRLKLDQNGSLTITDTRTTDSGDYKLLIDNHDIVKIFSVTVIGMSDARSVQISVKEGDPVTLHTGVDIKKEEDKMTWYFKNGRIAISNGQDIICEDNGCKERFRDRLKLDHQTGSLTITDTRTTDSGEYKLLIDNHDIVKIFNVAITASESDISKPGQDKRMETADTGSGLSSGDVTGIVIGVLLLTAAAGVVGVYWRNFLSRISRIGKKNNKPVPGQPPQDELLSNPV